MDKTPPVSSRGNPALPFPISPRGLARVVIDQPIAGSLAVQAGRRQLLVHVGKRIGPQVGMVGRRGDAPSLIFQGVDMGLVRAMQLGNAHVPWEHVANEQNLKPPWGGSRLSHAQPAARFHC
jgi:hypothetical protein